MPDGPWTQYQPAATDQPAQPQGKPWERYSAAGPWARYAAPAPSADSRPGLLERIGSTVKRGGEALGEDISNIASGLYETAKLPGEVAAGQVAPEDLPRAARQFAATFPAAGAPGGLKPVPTDAARAFSESLAGQRVADIAPQPQAEAAKVAAQQRTANTLQAAKEAVTAPQFTPADLGPALTGKVNMARFRAGQAPTDKFTLKDLETAGIKQDEVDRLTLGQRPATTALRTGATEPLASGQAATSPADISPAKEIAPSAAAPTGSPLTEAPAIAKLRRLEDQLFQLRNLETSDRLDALDAVKKLPEDYTPELDEKLYHHEENPTGVPLSAREQAIYDEHVAPIREEANALAKDLSRLTGVTPDLNDIYTPRYVAGRTRSYGEAIAQWMKGIDARFGGAAARTMRKTVDAQKGRDFFMAEHPETGDKTLVYVSPDRNVYAFDGTPQIKQFGKLAGNTGPKTGAIVRAGEGNFRLTQATTKEIEGQAQTRYIKSVMANRLDDLAKLRSAVRNAKFIEDMKGLPEFGDYFKPANETPIAPVTGGRPWRRPNVPQFQQYLADPRIADALDDFARTSKDAEGLNRALNAIGRAMNAVMFMNPKAHIDNVFNHMLIGRGLYGNIAHAPAVIRNLVRGAREVYTIGPEYRNALKAGLSLPYSRMVAADLHPTLLKRLGTEASANPRVWNRIASQMGYPSAQMMLQRWRQVPSRILWGAQDAMMMSRVMELKERGIPIEKAIRTSESEIPNYRVPGQVLGSRGLAELFGNPAFGRFGRYQYGRLRAYTDMLKQAFATTGGLMSPERLHAFDQLAMLGVYTFGVYSLYDWMWQEITGNPLASTVRSGASAIPKAIEDVYEGKKKSGDLIYNLFTIGVPIELASEAYQGRYGWSGQPIIRDADVRQAMKDPVRAKQVGRDIASYFAQWFSSIGTLASPMSTETAGQTGLRALGVVSPTAQQMQRRAKGQAIDEREAKRRAYKQEYAP